MKKYWDHSTKPSTYVVSIEGAVGFVGNYKDGMMYIKSLENKGMINFEEDYLPAMQVTTKRAYRALTTERELRRDIMKLKKEIKELKENGGNLLGNGDNNNDLGENLKALEQW